MKKVYQYLMLAGLIVLAAACENEIAIDNGVDGSEQQMITETISANIYGETKATVDANAKFAWTVGDNIAVHVSNGNYVLTSGEGGASVAAASASFTVSYPSGTSRDAFAIFPSTIVTAGASNYGQSGATLDVTLPASYTLEQVSGEATPCPMIATNAAGAGWTFRQLCGLLRLTVNGIPDDATGIVIQFPGKKVNGNFSIASPVTPGTSTIETGTPASGEDQITVTFNVNTTSATINLPLPTGDYEDVFITPVSSATKVAAVRHISAGSYTAQAAHGKKLTTTLVSFEGKTGVTSARYFIFAPGNLQYQASTNTWRFAEHQFDYVGNDEKGNVSASGVKSSNVSISATYSGWIDLFGWGTSGKSSWASPLTYGSNTQPYSIGTTSSDYGPTGIADLTGDYAEGDWGVYITIGSYAAGTWHALDFDQTYQCIQMGGNMGHAVIFDGTSEIRGLVLIPSLNWNDPNTTTNAGTPAQSFTKTTDHAWGTEGSAASSSKNYYTLETWASMEDAGAVFLPACGHRINTVNDVQLGGGYWMRNTTAESTARALTMGPGGASHTSRVQRDCGYAVRLVRDL